MLSQRVPAWLIPLVIAACGLVYLVGNGRVSLWDRDEPRYAMASRYMLQSGDWVVPRYGWGVHPEIPRTAKPVLIYWLQAGAMRLFGPNEFAARFPSSMATILLLGVIGFFLGRGVSRGHAFWGVLVLGTSAMLVIASKMCVIDPVLLCLVTPTQLCLYSLYRGRGGWGAVIILWVCLALGGLAKGPVALAIPLTTVLVLWALDRWRLGHFKLRWIFRSRPAVGVLILVALTVPWLVLVNRREPGFLHAAIFHEVLDRMKQGLEDHKGPPGYYALTIFGTFFPWSLLLPLTLVVAMGRWRRLPTVRFALAAVIGPWLLMECVQTKLVHYVLPIFPPLAFLVADAILRCLRGRHDGLRSRIAVIGAAIFAVAVAVAAGGLPWLILRHTTQVPWAAMGAMTAVAAGYSAGVWYWFASRRPAVALGWMGAGILVYVAVVFGIFLPQADFLRLSPRIGRSLVERGAIHPSQVLMTGYKERSLAFYQGGTIDECWTNFLTEHPVSDWPEYFVLTPEVLAKVPAVKAALLSEVERFEGLNYAASGRWTTVLIVRRPGWDGQKREFSR